MRFYSKTILSTLCIILSILIITACTQLGLSQKSSVSFNMNLSRAAIDTERFDDDIYVSVQLKGDYKAESTKVLDEEKGLKFSFSAVPVGANISAFVEIYTYIKEAEDAETEKLVFYSGESEPQVITEGVNTLNVKLKKLYEEEPKEENPDEPVVEPDDKEKDPEEENPDDKEKDPEEENPEEENPEEEPVEFEVIIKTDDSYIVNNPLFTKEYKKEKLETNIIQFDLENDLESYVWIPTEDINLSDYQKAIITYKGTELKDDEENVIAFKVTRTSWRNYYRDQKPVSTDSQTYEMPIPQGKGSLVLGIENKWDSEKGRFQNDFAFEVEKIELIKDDELAIQPGDKYIEENSNIEFLHNINNETDWSVGPNAIKWTSKEYEANGQDSGWAAGYWEFSNLSDYDMVAITVKGLNPNSCGMKFNIGGYLPYYEPDEDGNDSEFHSVYSRSITLDNENESVCVKLNVEDICTYKDADGNEKTFIPKAIEFLNTSFEGNWGPDMEWGDDWTLVVEKIELIKGEHYDELFSYLTIPVNQNWHFSIFNEYKSIVTCKEVTEDSITFTVNKELEKPEGMLQVVFGDLPYEEGKTYACTYKIKGPVTDTVKNMNVCWWVTKNQGNLFSDYNNENFTEHSFIINCNTTENGGLLFFPQVPGEYTISDVAVVEVDNSNPEKTNCTLKIELPSGDESDIEVNVDVQDSVYIFTAPEGYDTYSWKLKLRGEVVFTSDTNTFEVNAQNLITDVYYDLVLFADEHSYTRQLKINN